MKFRWRTSEFSDIRRCNQLDQVLQVLHFNAEPLRLKVLLVLGVFFGGFQSCFLILDWNHYNPPPPPAPTPGWNGYECGAYVPPVPPAVPHHTTTENYLQNEITYHQHTVGLLTLIPFKIFKSKTEFGFFFMFFLFVLYCFSLSKNNLAITRDSYYL